MNITVFGALGRIGKKIVETAKKRGHNVCEIDKEYVANRLEKVNVVIDFSTVEATQEVCDYCKKFGCALVSGVTGRNEREQALLQELNDYIKVIEKSNFSRGAAMLKKLCETVCSELKDWDCEIVETHRKGKKDAPAGTAKELLGIIASLKNSFSSVYAHSLRLGDNFGKHEVIFATDGESLTITHQAFDLNIFALGAVKTAEDLVVGLA